MKRTTYLVASVGALSVALAAPARAQAQGQARTNQPGETAQPPDQSHELDDIVVTAQKQSETAQRTPAAITAITGESLVQKGVTNLAAVQDLVPGARFHQEANTTQVFLRGVGSNLDLANVLPSVSFNFNGTYVPREGTSVGFYDIAQVEVLPGPQGTLYGRSAIGGTVNVSFNRPEFTNSFSQLVEVGNYGLVHPTLVANVALSDDLAVRFAADYVHHDGYMTSGAYSQKDFSGRASLLWRPSGTVSLYLWGFYANRPEARQTSSTRDRSRSLTRQAR
jgi:iron complex outermembrane receptor protein